jgi:hypothetical protein
VDLFSLTLAIGVIYLEYTNIVSFRKSEADPRVGYAKMLRLRFVVTSVLYAVTVVLLIISAIMSAESEMVIAILVLATCVIVRRTFGRAR